MATNVAATNAAAPMILSISISPLDTKSANIIPNPPTSKHLVHWLNFDEEENLTL
jgi:hypothetical protein